MSVCLKLLLLTNGKWYDTLTSQTNDELHKKSNGET